VVRSHVFFILGGVTSSLKAWLDKFSRIPITTWVELLVLEDWTNALEALGGLSY